MSKNAKILKGLSAVAGFLPAGSGFYCFHLLLACLFLLVYSGLNTAMGTGMEIPKTSVRLPSLDAIHIRTIRNKRGNHNAGIERNKKKPGLGLA